MAAEELEEVKGRGSSVVFIADEKRLLGGASIADTIRKEAKSAITALRGYQPSTINLISGDTKPVAIEMGKTLGLDEAIGEMLPVNKLEYITRLKTSGKK